MSAGTKTDNQTETAEINVEQVLLTKIKLSDGSMEFMFSRGPKYNDKLWPIQCHLCRVGYMINERKLRAHLNSEKHTTRLNEGPPNAEAYRKPYEQLYSDRMRLMNPIKIMPGEVIEEVTTQHLDRLMPCKKYNWENPPSDEIIEELSKDDIVEYDINKAPILGLCYAFKMYDSMKKIKYYCSLCSAFYSEHNAYQHFIGIQDNHDNEYAKRHYGDTINILEKLIDKSVNETDKKKWIKHIIRHIYGKVESWKGNRKMHIVDGTLFDLNRQRYLTKARKLLHYCDQLVNFSNEELIELIEICKEKGRLYPDDPERLPNQPPTPTKAEIEAERKAEEQRKRKNLTDNGPIKKLTRSDGDNRQKVGPKLDETPQNWAKYQNLVERALRSLNDEYGRFVDMSENHPQYRIEWNRFWRRRYSELREDNVNPNNYDFMPEWNRFWIRYLEDCYESDVDKCKFELRKNLRLPFRARTPDPSGTDINRRGNNYNNNLRSSLPQMSRGYDEHNDGGGSSGNNGNLNNSGGNRQTGPVPLMGIGTIKPESIHQQEQQQQEIEIPTEPLSVLSVLRLLTALEDQLGSLGPTAIQLLSKAIFFEKDTNSSANELLNENEYFTLFITALEKLKGQLLARIVPDMKIKAVKKAVDDLDTILKLFEEYKQRHQDNVHSKQAGSGGCNNTSGNNPNLPTGVGINQYSGGNDDDQWRSNTGTNTGEGDNRSREVENRGQGYGSPFRSNIVRNINNPGHGISVRSNWQPENNRTENQDFSRDISSTSNWRSGTSDDIGSYREFDKQMDIKNNRNNDFTGGNSALNSNMRNDNYNSSIWNTDRNQQSQTSFRTNNVNRNTDNPMPANLNRGGTDLGKIESLFDARNLMQNKIGFRNFSSTSVTGSGGGNDDGYSNYNSSFNYSSNVGNNSGQRYSSNQIGSGGGTGMYNRRY